MPLTKSLISYELAPQIIANEQTILKVFRSILITSGGSLINLVLILNTYNPTAPYHFSRKLHIQVYS